MTVLTNVNLSQQGLALLHVYPLKPCKVIGVCLMVAGVFCVYASTVGVRDAVEKGDLLQERAGSKKLKDFND